MAARPVVRTVVECKSCESRPPDLKDFFSPRWFIELLLECGHTINLRLPPGLLPGLVRKDPGNLSLWRGEKVTCYECRKKEVEDDLPTT
jgi:hypothetical protein